MATVLNKHRNRSEPVQKRFDFISFHWNICVFFKQITSNYHSSFISSSRLNQQKPICTHTKQPYKIHEPTSIVYKHFTLLSRVYCLFAPYNLNCKNNRNNIIYNNTFLIRIKLCVVFFISISRIPSLSLSLSLSLFIFKTRVWFRKTIILNAHTIV